MTARRSRPVVVDASAVLDLLLRQRWAAQVEAVMLSPFVRLHSPQLLDKEVLSATRRIELAGEIGREQADSLVERFAEVPVQRHGLSPFLDQVWAMRHAITVSDAYYVCLSRALDAPLLTTDDRLARGVEAQHGLSVVELS